MTQVIVVPIIASVGARIVDTFNRPDQDGIGTASDGGTWYSEAYGSGGTPLDPSTVIDIVGNRLSLANSGTVNGTVGRQIPGSPSAIEISLDVHESTGSFTSTIIALGTDPDFFNLGIGTGYVVYFDSEGGQYCFIAKRDPASGFNFVAFSPDFTLPAWNDGSGPTLTVVRNGATLQLIHNGTIYGEWTDPDPHPPTYHVSITGEVDVLFDNFDAGPLVNTYAPVAPSATISIFDDFNRPDGATPGILGDTSDGLATWETRQNDPGFGFRVLDNAAFAYSGTDYQVVDALGTAPGIVSGILRRNPGIAQGMLGLLYSYSGAYSTDDDECYWVSIYSSTDFVAVGKKIAGGEETLGSYFNEGIGIQGNRFGLTVDPDTHAVMLYVNDVLVRTILDPSGVYPPPSSLHGIRSQGAGNTFYSVDDWRFDVL